MTTARDIAVKSRISKNVDRGEHGSTLIETVIAMFLLSVGVLGVMGALSVAITQNWNMGDRATRTTEYAQDKMEQLLALGFNDSASNTATFPTASTGGTGLGGVMAANATVGGVTSGSPITGYVDYVNSAGSFQTTSTGALYIRQWRISTNATGTLKTVTVVTRALISSHGANAPSTTLVSIKSL
ncbi:MAG TPA: prepilin-type N-terminal cleavage/methylation domain-containing protein [Pyrinomonadaceae bacterium]|nr:prepilin-type N-terminal cleavage/methylation domain-containing protein [Pyrinomonadaceae bacterium]